MFRNNSSPTRAVTTGLIAAVAVWGALNVRAADQTRSAGAKETAFIKEAIHGGQAEVAMGKLAAEKGQNPEIKMLGQRLQQDHTKANQELMQIAQKHGVTVMSHSGEGHDKTAAGQSSTVAGHEKKVAGHDTSVAGHDPSVAGHGKADQAMSKLQEKTGAEFDKAFAEHALMDHQKDIGKYQQASQDLNDPELKAYIGKTLPVLRQHLEMARKAGSAVGVDQSTLSAADQFLSDHNQALGSPGSSETGRGSSTSSSGRNSSGTSTSDSEPKAKE